MLRSHEISIMGSDCRVMIGSGSTFFGIGAGFSSYLSTNSQHFEYGNGMGMGVNGGILQKNLSTP